LRLTVASKTMFSAEEKDSDKAKTKK